jgi:MOSC domain-containing protein YiiM
VTTGIFKAPVEGRVALRRHNLDGDAQADLSVHGGPDKAVYAYPVENYDYWRGELPGRELPPGSFGENLTVEGLTEDSVHIGDEFRVGTARLVVTQPRMPCYKLGLRFNDPEMVKRFLASRRPGFYLGVVEEGELGAGDPIERVREDENRVAVTEMLRLIVAGGTAIDADSLRRVLRVPALAAVWRQEFQERLGS